MLSDQLAAQAEFIVKNFTQTDYQHTTNIVPSEGIYVCDCNGFVNYVLDKVAPNHYAQVLNFTNGKRPQAYYYHDFFTSPTLASIGGWQRILKLVDARRGDIIAWRYPTIQTHENTGHVLFVAETPVINDEGVYYVQVYDSAAYPHFDDTRTTASNLTHSGVGSGIINFKVDASGSPIAFQFAPPATAQYDYLSIAIGRAIG